MLKLLHVIGTLDPRWGGPVEALTHRSRMLQACGHESEIVTLDAPGAPWLDGVPSVHALGPSHGRYRFCADLRPWLRAHVAEYDAIVASGIWQYHSLAVWRAAKRACIPYFVFVHGALDPWFSRRYPLKHLKKALYWSVAESRVLRDASAVLFTSSSECLSARGVFRPYRLREAVVGYGVPAPPGEAPSQREAFLRRYGYLREKRMLLFLSRLHPKKGCDLAIQALARASESDQRLHLVIAGPDEGGYQASMLRLARKLGVADRITWAGMVCGDLKWGAFHAADALLLPSHSENFGIVVAEALACGLPVLISDKVNIWREIADGGAGLVEPDTVTGATRLLQRWLSMPASESERMRRAAAACFQQHFGIEAAVATLVDTIEASLAKAEHTTPCSVAPSTRGASGP